LKTTVPEDEELMVAEAVFVSGLIEPFILIFKMPCSATTV
jgi:hypothetical protein